MKDFKFINYFATIYQKKFSTLLLQCTCMCTVFVQLGYFFQMLQLHFGTETLVCQIILFDFNPTYFTCKSRCTIECKMIITVLLYYNSVINLNERKKNSFQLNLANQGISLI